MSDGQTLSELADEILELKSKLITWRAVAQHYSVSPAVVWRIANDGYEPKGNEVRRKLGLEEIVYFRATRDKRGRFQRRHN